jgi:hypothetical protein
MVPAPRFALGETAGLVGHIHAGRLGRLDTWPATLTVGQPLPTLPLWLLGELPIPIDLEMSYEETCRVLRIR